MKKSRFTENQMARILREADQPSVSAAAKAHGVSEQSWTWRKRCGELQVDITLDDRKLDLVEASFGLATRIIGELPESPLVARRLGPCGGWSATRQVGERMPERPS